MSAEREFKGSRKPFIGGNWKMNGTRRKAEDLISALNKSPPPPHVEVVVAPTFIHLDLALRTLRPPYHVSAQNAAQFADGAYTGEVSVTQLKDLGVNFVILGHSERRKLFGDSDEVVAEKIKRALAAGLHVIACIGETLEERKAGQTSAVVLRQLAAIGGAVSDWSRVVLAYEPVWAIGTGVVATPEQAQDVHAELRLALRKSFGEAVAAATRLIYGGSVKADNCDALFDKADVDGFLVGGASLNVEEFLRIVNCKPKSSL